MLYAEYVIHYFQIKKRNIGLSNANKKFELMCIYNTYPKIVEYTFFKSTYNSQLPQCPPMIITSWYSHPWVVPLV